MRQAFIDTLYALAAKDKKIILMNGDLGFSVLEGFMSAYPDRSYNMGVAEANMIGAAAGYAREGYTVFVYSIIPFVTMRVFEQVRNDIAMQNANVKIVGVGCGFTYGQLGPTHHSVEDIAVMRSIPGMTVVCPGDPAETREATKTLARMRGPAYLRIGKRGEPEVHAGRVAFQLGSLIPVSEGSDCVLFATGNMLKSTIDVAKMLHKQRVSAAVVSVPTVKPLDAQAVSASSRGKKGVFTLEEHSIIGGLGSAVAEVLAEQSIHVPHFHRFGVLDTFTYRAGSQEYLRSLHGLTPLQITKKILQIFKKA
ncbi:MAG: hypothetical protein A3J54_02385 [Candidatus Ryanbacteria bacterium RIFCSPHIGHO2_02_FULL_45_13b]|uniref:Transketolase-like pyrimidine-binding domain-containing protein n=1 Tax=Candidatus Ryanbacteria bacterium RIFCSPHIGHO2_02_FULL_45_13b TaxID=1802117 RepID=A0A1G2GC31_9BACT|nr:MAG: hypothetical protein A3J54_02385 [Candidatus Ryanbacteria bacterium RIFCSPHIGHO2_02_FULL_45_13b]